MKNIMKKVVIIAILVMMMACMSGFTYQTEEAPKALIMELIEAGFTVSEDDENIWIFEQEMEDLDEGEYAMIYGRFDTDENIGTLTVIGKWIDAGEIVHFQSYVVQWNAIDEEMECIGKFEY